jgi:hypothetical protein
MDRLVRAGPESLGDVERASSPIVGRRLRRIRRAFALPRRRSRQTAVRAPAAFAGIEPRTPGFRIISALQNACGCGEMRACPWVWLGSRRFRPRPQASWPKPRPPSGRAAAPNRPICSYFPMARPGLEPGTTIFSRVKALLSLAALQGFRRSRGVWRASGLSRILRAFAV